MRAKEVLQGIEKADVFEQAQVRIRLVRDEEVVVALAGPETVVAGGRTEQLQPRNMMLTAELLYLGKPFFYNRRHLMLP